MDGRIRRAVAVDGMYAAGNGSAGLTASFDGRGRAGYPGSDSDTGPHTAAGSDLRRNSQCGGVQQCARHGSGRLLYGQPGWQAGLIRGDGTEVIPCEKDGVAWGETTLLVKEGDGWHRTELPA